MDLGIEFTAFADSAPEWAEVSLPLSVDWLEDPSLSGEEILARFRSLGPEPTRGPEA